MKKMNNKGFSLVELIVVIAIMAVLVGVLAPQFIKYVENSRRSTDISAAESIRSSILADIADQRSPFNSSSTGTEIAGTNLPSAISEAPVLKSSKASANQHFYAAWDSTKGTCDVYATVDGAEYNFTDVNGAYNYKNQLKTSSDKGFKTQAWTTRTSGGGSETPSTPSTTS